MKASKLLPLLGIVAVGLIVACFVIVGETPDTDDPMGKITAFYIKNDSEVEASGVLLMAAAAAFLVWAIQIRSVLFAAEGGTASRTTLGLVGAVFFGVGLCVFAGFNFALGDHPEKFSPEAMQAMHVLSEDLFPPMAVGLVLLLFGDGLAILKTRVMPAWLGWICIIGAIGTFTPAWFIPFIGVGIFLLVSSVLLATRTEAAAA
jgi:hypothetical protein